MNRRAIPTTAPNVLPTINPTGAKSLVLARSCALSLPLWFFPSSPPSPSDVNTASVLFVKTAPVDEMYSQCADVRSAIVGNRAEPQSSDPVTTPTRTGWPASSYWKIGPPLSLLLVPPQDEGFRW